MSLLGEEIEESGTIKYIALPQIYDTDKPVKENLPEFKENLKEAILTQIEKVRKNQEVSKKMEVKIKSFLWGRLVEDMNNMISSIIDA